MQLKSTIEYNLFCYEIYMCRLAIFLWKIKIPGEIHGTRAIFFLLLAPNVLPHITNKVLHAEHSIKCFLISSIESDRHRVYYMNR